MNRTIRTLIIEDSTEDAALLVRELRRGGFKVEHERVDTIQALEAALVSQQWHVVFCDYTLPRFSGRSPLNIVQESGLDLPFIYVSGTIGEDVAIDAMKAGAHDYVFKDNLKRLAPAVERELRCAGERRQRRNAEQALQASEHKYRSVFESLTDAALVVDETTGSILDANAQAEALFQRPQAELLGMNHRQLYPPSSAKAPPLLQPGGMAGRKQAQCDTEVLRQDGQNVPVNLSVSQLVLSGHRLWLALFRDVTERNALEAQVRHAQKMEAVGQLASGVAHDFNNLLSVMGGNADLLLLDADQFSPHDQECLRQIVETTAQAANLTRQLLLFSRKQVLQARPLDLNELIANLSKMLKRVIPEDIRLEFSYGEQLPLVQANPGMMEQVLLNLVVNARDAMPTGGHLRISTDNVTLDKERVQASHEAREGQFVCLSVSDTGTGIDPEHLPRIFEPFFTTKQPGKGTGIGLATVYGIVKQHQGWIEVSSRIGAGTVFKLLLPTDSPPAQAGAAAPPGAETAPQSQAGLQGGSETILLVEDDRAVRKIMRQVLENYRSKVIEAACGREATQIWDRQAGAIDLLLTDIVMPEGVTGRQLAEQLRAKKPGLKVILMSGYNSDAVMGDTEFLRRSKFFFIRKPSSSEILVRTVRQCLDKNEALAVKQ